MLKWQVGLRWYAAALFIFPVLILAVLLGLTAQISPVFAPNWVAFGIVGGLIAGFVEEIGWTGYAYPKMQLSSGLLQVSSLPSTVDTWFKNLDKSIWRTLLSNDVRRDTC